MEPALLDLRARLAEVSDLSRAAGVLGWDQRVTMPPRGTEARAEQLSTLGRIAHERFTDDEVGRLLDRAEPLVESQPYDSDDRSLVRVTRRDWEKARRVPTELRAEMTLQAARGHHAWVEARRHERLRLVPPLPADERRAEAALRRVLRVVRQPVHAAPRRLRARDADDRGARGLRRAAPRARPSSSRRAPEVDASFLHGDFAPDAQRAFAERVLATLGFDDGAWRLDPTAHPFCTSFSNRDVRLTTRYRPDDLESVWSTLHEAGHGLYAHGIADALLRSPLHGAPSLGINESQSRTWENLVGRCRPFWEHWYGPLQERFPRAPRRRARHVRPRDQPRRARADPRRRRRDDLQPPHHPPLRARAGADRGDGRARGPARDLERADEGVPRRRRAGRTRDGVLQDVHWSGGGIGYFPTYALGNVISLQIWDVVRGALPDLDDQLAAGDLLPLSDWLRDNLYALGRKLTPKETIERLTGSPAIDPAPYLAYLGDKVAALAAEPARRARAGRDPRGPRRPRAGRRREARARADGDARDAARRRRPGDRLERRRRGDIVEAVCALSDRVSLAVVEHDEPGPWPTHDHRRGGSSTSGCPWATS